MGPNTLPAPEQSIKNFKGEKVFPSLMKSWSRQPVGQLFQDASFDTMWLEMNENGLSIMDILQNSPNLNGFSGKPVTNDTIYSD